MNKVLSLIVVIVIAMLVFISSAFVVSQKESAIKLRFGEIITKDIQPGLHFKVPFFDNVKKFDARIQVVNISKESYKTKGSEILDVSSFVQWKIIDTETYYKNARGLATEAARILKTRANDSLRAEFGKLSLTEVVSSQRDEMIRLALRKVSEQASGELGIEVVDLKIQTIQLQADILAKVYERMKSGRFKIAQEDRSAGSKEKIEIQSEAELKQAKIKAEAYREAEIIRGEGDAEAAKIYADAFNKDPEFYAFLRSLRAYETALGGESDVMVLDQNSDFFKYLQPTK